jgi:hypothetical protein
MEVDADADGSILAKIEEFFDSNGLSGFGKAMAKQWVVSALSDRFPKGSCARVLHWLRQQLASKRTWFVVIWLCVFWLLRNRFAVQFESLATRLP